MTQWQTIDAFSGVTYARYIVPNFASNCISVKLSSDHFLVISPGPELFESWHAEHAPDVAIENLKLHIVLPNHYHYLGAENWLEKVPHATFHASRQATKRLSKKLSKTVLPIETSEVTLPEDYYWLYPEGHPSGDAWLCAKSGGDCLWIICDSFVNYPRLSRQPIARLTQRLAGTAPGLKISTVMKYLIIRDRPSFKTWCLAHLERDKPTHLLPSHGELKIDSSLEKQLSRLVKERL